MFMYERYTVLRQSVKNLAQSNIFEAGAVEISELFGDYLEGDVTPGACVALALGETAPSDAVRNAIVKSLAALGYGENACTFATLLPFDQDIEGADIPLDAQSLFLLVEGLDPLRIIVTDRRSADLLASAYRTAFPNDSAARTFGKPTAVFRDLNTLLQTDVGKQKAWAVLKTLA